VRLCLPAVRRIKPLLRKNKDMRLSDCSEPSSPVSSVGRRALIDVGQPLREGPHRHTRHSVECSSPLSSQFRRCGSSPLVVPQARAWSPYPLRSSKSKSMANYRLVPALRVGHPRALSGQEGLSRRSQIHCCWEARSTAVGRSSAVGPWAWDPWELSKCLLILAGIAALLVASHEGGAAARHGPPACSM
jgi:hypothetical protein